MAFATAQGSAPSSPATSCTLHMNPQNVTRKTITERFTEFVARPPALACDLEIDIHPALDLGYVDVTADKVTKTQLKKAEKKLASEMISKDDKLRTEWETKAARLKAAIERNKTLIRDDAIAATRPAFELASAIMQDKEQLPFWHGLMVTGKEFQCQAEDDYVTRTFTAKEQLSEGEIADTLQFLENMGKQVFIDFEVLNDFECGRTLLMVENFLDVDDADPGYCAKLKQWQALPRLPHDDRVCTARIALKRSFLTRCLAWRDTTVLDLQRLWVRIACTLLHELAHVADAFAYRGRLTKKYLGKRPFFRDEACAEVGFAYEKYVFGDMVHVFWQRGDYFVNLRSWPNQKLVSAHDLTAENGEKHSLETRGQIPADILVSRTPWDAIAAYFNKDAWAMRSSGSNGLRLRLVLCCTRAGTPAVVSGPDHEQNSEYRSAERMR